MGEHTYVERADQCICDFCCSRPPTCQFSGSPSSKTMEVAAGDLTISEDGIWAACDDCAQLIVARRCDLLAAFVASKLPSGLIPPREMVAMLQDMYENLLPTLGPRVEMDANRPTAMYATGSPEFIAAVKLLREDLLEHNGIHRPDEP